MCNPAIAYYAIATVVTLYAAKEQVDATNQTAKYNMAIAQQNEDLSKQQATDARARGEAAAAEQRLKTRLLIGNQRAIMAGHNVDLSSGTPLEILGNTAMMGQVDEDRIRMAAAREAWGYDVQATNFANQGQYINFERKTQNRATVLGAAASLSQTWAGAAGGAGARKSAGGTTGGGFTSASYTQMTGGSSGASQSYMYGYITH